MTAAVASPDHNAERMFVSIAVRTVPTHLAHPGVYTVDAALEAGKNPNIFIETALASARGPQDCLSVFDDKLDAVAFLQAHPYPDFLRNRDLSLAAHAARLHLYLNLQK